MLIYLWSQVFLYKISADVGIVNTTGYTVWITRIGKTIVTNRFSYYNIYINFYFK